MDIFWHGPPVPDAVPLIEKEIMELLNTDLLSISHLLLHIVFLGDYDDPSITCWGVDSDHRLHCEYKPAGHSDSMEFDLEDFKDAPWYKAIKDLNDD